MQNQFKTKNKPTSRMRGNVIAAMAVAALMLGCGENAPPGAAQAAGDKGLFGDDPRFVVRYHHDSERGVSCWFTSNGISCLPDSALSGLPAR